MIASQGYKIENLEKKLKRTLQKEQELQMELSKYKQIVQKKNNDVEIMKDQYERWKVSQMTSSPYRCG